MGAALRYLVLAAAVGALVLAPGAATGQMGPGMGPQGNGMMGGRPPVQPREGEPASSPGAATSRPVATPGATGASPGAPAGVGPGTATMPMPEAMGPGASPRPFYLERTFLVLVGVAGTAVVLVAYRVARRRRQRPAVPSGFVTEAVLVVDVVGSTHLATQYGDAVALQARTAVKDRVLVAAGGHGLRFAENTGDGCLATFGSVAGALATARAVLDGLRTQPPDLAPAPALEVRVGIAWGEILFDDRGNRHGAVINKAFRLEGVAPGAFVRMEGEQPPAPIAERNRIYLDEAAAEEARVAGVALRVVGFASLKGFPGLHRVYEAAA